MALAPKEFKVYWAREAPRQWTRHRARVANTDPKKGLRAAEYTGRGVGHIDPGGPWEGASV